MSNVLIGIQARSTSNRLPQKVHLQIGGKPLLQWVIDSCQIASRFIQSEGQKLDANVTVALLIPKGDCIGEIYKGQLPIVEGDEHDVLSRYVSAAKQFGAEHIVRVTGDCLFIPPHHITKHVKAALIKGRDYTTNIHFRSHKEGWDCEVMTRRLLDWLDENAKEPSEREHVTTKIANGKPFPFQYLDGKPSICHLMNHYDESEIKTSIDTKEEFEAAKKIMDRYDKLKKDAKRAGTFQT